MQPAVTAELREISHAETGPAALAAIATFKEKYAAKHERGVTCPTKDAEALLVFYRLRPVTPRTIPRTVRRCADRRSPPAEHRDHLRTSNPIESVFAAVRHRRVRTRGALSRKTARLMAFTLVGAASKTWRKLNGTNRLPRLIDGVTFTDGLARDDDARNRAA